VASFKRDGGGITSWDLQDNPIMAQNQQCNSAICLQTNWRSDSKDIVNLKELAYTELILSIEQNTISGTCFEKMLQK
jgi:hypothetical protein